MEAVGTTSPNCQDDEMEQPRSSAAAKAEGEFDQHAEPKYLKTCASCSQELAALKEELAKMREKKDYFMKLYGSLLGQCGTVTLQSWYKIYQADCNCGCCGFCHLKQLFPDADKEEKEFLFPPITVDRSRQL